MPNTQAVSDEDERRFGQAWRDGQDDFDAGVIAALRVILAQLGGEGADG